MNGEETPELTAAVPGRRLGMWIFLCSETAFFAALVAAYIVLRAGASLWPRPGTLLSLKLAWANTLLLIASGFTMAGAIAAARRGATRWLTIALAATLLLGAAFLAGQVVEWRYLLLARHVIPSTSLFSSLFFVLTGLHGLHVLAGLVVLLIVFGKAATGRYAGEPPGGVELAGLYWHFVDIVWIALFLLLYLI